MKHVSSEDPFRRLYDPSTYQGRVGVVSSAGSFPALTLSAHAIPFSVFSRVLSDKFSVGLVFSEKLSQKTITAEFKETSLSDVLNVISRQLDSEVVKVGNTFYIGQLRSQDRGILVRKVEGLKNADIRQAVQSCLSEKGKLSVIGSGILSAVDHESVLVRVSELLDYFSRVDQPVWILQLAFLIVQRDALVEGGAKLSTSGTLSYNVSESSFSVKDLKIDGIINAAMSSSFADVVSSPMLLIREGSSSSWKFGKKVPIPKKTVSSYGVVSTTGFDYESVGFSVKASVVSSRIGAVLDLVIEKSDIESYVEYAPVTAQNVYSFTADLRSDTPYLLGEFNTFKNLNTQTDILNLGRQSGKSIIQLWGQLYRINPGLKPGIQYKFPSLKKKGVQK